MPAPSTLVSPVITTAAALTGLMVVAVARNADLGAVWWVLPPALLVFVPLSALAGVAAAVACRTTYYDEALPTEHRAFLAAAVLGSGGLLGPLIIVSKWLGRRRGEPAVPAPEVKSPRPVQSPLRAVGLSAAATQVHIGQVPRARRQPARMERIQSPLRPADEGTLAPTVQVRRTSSRRR